MFLGVVPTECIKQIFTVMEIENWTDVHVCCSGTFRLDRALIAKYPGIRVHSNDVSAYSSVIGGLGVGKPYKIKFTNRLDWVEHMLKGSDDLTRAAGVMVAFEMAKFSKQKTDFDIHHYKYYQDNFKLYVDQTAKMLESKIGLMNFEDYFAGDWRVHADNAIKMGSGILAFPPFFKGGYEKQFEFVDENIEWNAPSYDMYDPEDLHDITLDLEEKGGKFCVLTDQIWDDREPVLKYLNGRRAPHYCYANVEKTSLVHKRGKTTQFKYKPIDLDKIRHGSKVSIVPADAKNMNFIKDVYLSNAIIHSSGMQNFLVYIDDMLLGSIIYDESPVTRSAYGPRTINLLSDLSISKGGKLSKLVAMIATSHELVRPMEMKLLKRYDRLVTTAFTKRQSSMKYRGVFKKLSRRANDAGDGFVIQYAADVSQQTPQQLYKKWWKQHGPTRTKTSD